MCVKISFVKEGLGVVEKIILIQIVEYNPLAKDKEGENPA